jgi:rod shape-determining protein MreC
MLELWIRYRKYTRLLLVLIACFGLLAYQQSRPGGVWLADSIGTVAAPIQTAFARAHRAAASVWITYLEWKGLRADAERLRSEVTALRLRQLRQDELEAENVRLRTLLTLSDRLPVRTLGAEVVGREWNGFTRTLTINRGRTDGLVRLAPVIVTGGVVGRVVELRRGSAVVQLVTDPASAIGGVVTRTRTQGLVEGVAGGRMRFKVQAREDGITPGDVVYTSGMAGIFPKGLPLGRVTRVHGATGVFRIADVEPTVDMATVEEVLVLPVGIESDLSQAFAREG